MSNRFAGRLGSQKVNLLADNQIAREVGVHQGLLRDLAIPKDMTQRTFQKMDAEYDLVLCNDADNLFEGLRF